MSTDLIESRTDRDRYSTRVDVLDKVKALRMLLDDVHVTTELVANYYEVDAKAVEKLVERHRSELTSNGYRVISGVVLADMKSVNRIDARRSLAVFTRRAVLNVGMLLRDSPIAQRVRTYLLNAEESDRQPTFDLTSLSGIEQLIQAAQTAVVAAKAQEQRAIAAETKVEELEPYAEGYRHFLEVDDTVKWANACNVLGVGPNLLSEYLRQRKILHTDRYTVERHGVEETRDGERHNRPYSGYEHWFSYVPYGESDRLDRVPEHKQYDRRVTKAGMEQLRRVLKRHVVECGRCSMCGQVELRKPHVWSEWRPQRLPIGVMS